MRWAGEDSAAVSWLTQEACVASAARERPISLAAASNEDGEAKIMTVMNVATLTVQRPGWDLMMENSKKAKVILEKHGAKNVRLLGPVEGGGPSGTVHSFFEADDLAAAGKVLDDAIHADPEMIPLMQTGAETTSHVSSLLTDVPLS